jgi:hypothetical protein
MGTVNLIVVIESVRTVISKQGDELREFHLPSIIAVAVALGEPQPPFDQQESHQLPAVKLSLFIYSFSIRKQSSQVQVLWEDHRNDVIVNAFGTHSASLTLQHLPNSDQVSSCLLVEVS